jgi:hypothetical protein
MLRTSGCRRLLLQCLGEFARPRLLGLEQPHVLDGDYCLVCEGLDQLNLPVAQWAHISAPDEDRADGLAAPKEGHTKRGVPTGAQRSLTTLRVLVRLGLSTTWIVCRSMTARPLGVPRTTGSVCSPTCPGKEICPRWAARRRTLPSTWGLRRRWHRTGLPRTRQAYRGHVSRRASSG